MTEAEYRKLNRISYSKLSGLTKSPASLIATSDTWGAGIQFGSMVDILMFDGKDVFDAQFCTIESTPSKFIASVIEKIVILNNPFGGDSFPPLKDCKRNIEIACKQLKYGQTWKPETRLSKILEAEPFYLNLKKCADKRVVDKEDYEKAKEAVNNLAINNFSAHYFKAQDGQEVFFQVPILWEYKGLECKSLFDMLTIDHTNKTIQVSDLKTTGLSVYSFRNAFMDWHYYIQAAFYTDALLYAQENPEAFQVEGIPDCKGYKLLPFDFVVIGIKSLHKPLVWRTPQEFLEAGRIGGFINGTPVRGYKQLVEDYLWHLDKGLYDYHRDIYEKNGIMDLKLPDGANN